MKPATTNNPRQSDGAGAASLAARLCQAVGHYMELKPQPSVFGAFCTHELFPLVDSETRSGAFHLKSVRPFRVPGTSRVCRCSTLSALFSLGFTLAFSVSADDFSNFRGILEGSVSIAYFEVEKIQQSIESDQYKFRPTATIRGAVQRDAFWAAVVNDAAQSNTIIGTNLYMGAGRCNGADWIAGRNYWKAIAGAEPMGKNEPKDPTLEYHKNMASHLTQAVGFGLRADPQDEIVFSGTNFITSRKGEPVIEGSVFVVSNKVVSARFVNLSATRKLGETVFGLVTYSDVSLRGIGDVPVPSGFVLTAVSASGSLSNTVMNYVIKRLQTSDDPLPESDFCAERFLPSANDATNKVYSIVRSNRTDFLVSTNGLVAIPVSVQSGWRKLWVRIGFFVVLSLGIVTIFRSRRKK